MEAANATTSAPANSLRAAEPATAQPSNTNYAIAPNNVEAIIPSANAQDIRVQNSMSGQTDWTASLNEDLKGYIQTKGFKDPASVVDSYRGLEKLIGVKDKLLKLPDNDDQAAWNEVYDKLGRPKDPKDYKFELPKETNPEFESWARDNFHKLGLTKKQGEELLKGYVELNSNTVQKQEQAKQIDLKAQEDNLKKSWGHAFDQNVQMAKNAAAQFGFDAPTIDKLENAFGYEGAMKLLQTLGAKVGEASFVSSNSPKGFGVLTPDQAKYEIAELKKDAGFIQKWSTGDREAKAKLEHLHKWAYPE
jgi:hypothetical protein